MNKPIFAGAMLLALVAGASTAQSAPVPERAPGIIPPTTAAADNPPASQRDWLDGIAGKTLTALDGSALTLTLTEDGFARHLVSPSGDKQDTGFTFINRNLGTVSEDSAVVGFFRRNGDSLEVTFQDGRSETISAAQDGVSMILHSGDSGAHCMNWFPEGHTYNDAEKRIALALYAKKLGLASPVASSAPSVDSCSPAATQTSSDDMTPVSVPVNAVVPPKPPAAIPPAARHRKRTAALSPPVLSPLATLDTPAPLVNVAVRQSDVHPIDDMTQAASYDPDHGASSCLSVDSDGNHLGFRNHCRFDVEFAYCLKDAGTDIASCDKGPESGLVAANSFTPLLRSTALGGNDAERHFRWVGCALVDGALEARLDQTNPPAGRCVAPSAS
ncbi:MAG: hypothetical protein HY243_03950 [Proteobacteria bacterium]|nr:hypothetical protein [Pseudomonadota bacterium]